MSATQHPKSGSFFRINLRGTVFAVSDSNIHATNLVGEFERNHDG